MEERDKDVANTLTNRFFELVNLHCTGLSHCLLVYWKIIIQGGTGDFSMVVSKFASEL